MKLQGQKKFSPLKFLSPSKKSTKASSKGSVCHNYSHSDLKSEVQSNDEYMINQYSIPKKLSRYNSYQKNKLKSDSNKNSKNFFI